MPKIFPWSEVRITLPHLVLPRQRRRDLGVRLPSYGAGRGVQPPLVARATPPHSVNFQAKGPDDAPRSCSASLGVQRHGVGYESFLGRRRGTSISSFPTHGPSDLSSPDHRARRATSELRIPDLSSPEHRAGRASSVPEPWHAEKVDHELSRAAFRFGGRGV